MTFDVVAVFPDHIKHVPRSLLSTNLKMVVDHLAKPPIKDKGWSPWTDQIRAAAESPMLRQNLRLEYCCCAGLNSRHAETVHRLAVQTFGADRLMFGHRPVALLANDYTSWPDANRSGTLFC